MPKKTQVLTEEEQVKELRGLLADDRKWRQLWSEEDSWPEYERRYRGQFRGAGVSPVNLYYPFARGTVAQVYFRNPSVTIVDLPPKFTVRAKILEHLDSILFSKLRIKSEIKAAAQDIWHCGTGFLVHGYDSEFAFPSLEVKEQNTNIEYNTGVIPGMPWSLRAHPIDVTVAWGTVSPKSIRRYTIRRARPLDDVKSDSRYDKKALDALKAGTLESGSFGEKGTAINLKEDWVYLYETHDLARGRMTVTTDDVDRFLLNQKDELVNVLHGPNITPIVWNANASALWGVPDAKILEQDQLTINDANTQIINQLRANLSRFFYNRDAISAEELSKFLSEQPWVGIAVDGDVDQDIKLLTPPNLTGLFSETELLESRARRTLGYPRTRSGEYTAPTKRVTGKEVLAVESGAEVGLDEKRDAISDAIIDMVSKWNRLVFNSWDRYRLIFAPDIAPPISWIAFRGKDLEADYTYRIQPEELQPITTESRKRDALTIGTMLMKIAGSLQGIDARSILRQALRQFPEWDINKVLPPTDQERPELGLVAVLRSDGTLMPVSKREPSVQQNATLP